MSSKPVYVPPHKRQRFHGAFTGGFSAGYFNTVGTKEGWKPMQNASTEQKAQDYMDDQDFNEWGGPSSVKGEYTFAWDTQQDKPAAKSSRPLSSSFLDWSIIQPQNVGSRLLRVLGWREGAVAYVPSNIEDASSSADLRDDEETAVLSKKRLRKVQLQQNLIHIPPPKLDTGGLGYNVYRNAPEFQAHKDKRRLQAKQRSHAATTMGGANTYRASELQIPETVDPRSINRTDSIAHVSTEDAYNVHETWQEFVGTRGAAGFALRDDDDDVYDNVTSRSSSIFIDKDEFNPEIYEHESDVEDTDSKKPNVGELLSSWAIVETLKSDQGVTSDGKHPLSGFVLGVSNTHGDIVRFPGPEVPRNYVVNRHKFRDDEHPAILQQTARQEQLFERRQKALKRLAEPMAGGTFSGLAAAIRSRFTSATASTSTEAVTSAPEGLHRPILVEKPSETCEDPLKEPVKNEFKIETTHLIFYPELLVCKRLGIAPPVHSKTKPIERKENAESTFFELEVMKHVIDAKPFEPITENTKEAILNMDVEVKASVNDQRPAMTVYKSIFEPNSESEPDEDDTAIDASEPGAGDIDGSSLHQPSQKITSTEIVQAVATNTLRRRRDESDDEQKKSKRKRRDKKKKRASRNVKLTSSESDLDASTSDEKEHSRGRKMRRSRKEAKKKRKSHKKYRRNDE